MGDDVHLRLPRVGPDGLDEADQDVVLLRPVIIGFWRCLLFDRKVGDPEELAVVVPPRPEFLVDGACGRVVALHCVGDRGVPVDGPVAVAVNEDDGRADGAARTAAETAEARLRVEAPGILQQGPVAPRVLELPATERQDRFGKKTKKRTARTVSRIRAAFFIVPSCRQTRGTDPPGIRGGVTSSSPVSRGPSGSRAPPPGRRPPRGGRPAQLGREP